MKDMYHICYKFTFPLISCYTLSRWTGARKTCVYCVILYTYSMLLGKVACYGRLITFVKSRVAHAPGMPERFPRHRLQRKPPVSGPDMHHSTYMPWCMLLGIANPQWWGKRYRHSWCISNPQFYISGKMPMRKTKCCSVLRRFECVLLVSTIRVTVFLNQLPAHEL